MIQKQYQSGKQWAARVAVQMWSPARTFGQYQSGKRRAARVAVQMRYPARTFCQYQSDKQPAARVAVQIRALYVRSVTLQKHYQYQKGMR